MPPQFRKIAPRIHNDEKFRALSWDAQHLFMILLTHPELKPIGTLRTTKPGLLEELAAKGLPTERGEAAILAVVQGGFIKADWKAGLIIIPNFLVYNRATSPKQILGWHRYTDSMPECEMLTEHFARIQEIAEGWGPEFVQALPEGMIVREKPPKATKANTVDTESADKFLRLWNEHRGKMSEAKTMEPGRLTKIRARLRSSVLKKLGIVASENFVPLIRFMAADKFYTGGGNRGWVANIDYLVKSDGNVVRLVEQMGQRGAGAGAGSGPTKDTWAE